MINNIDVTLRDGGYQNNFQFCIEYAKEHVKHVSASGVQWIEIGYRNGSFKPIPNIGMTGISDDNYIAQLHEAVPDARLCVIAHAHNITKVDVEAMRRHGVEMLRLCMKPNSPEDTLDLCQFAKSLGMTVCINFTRVSQQPVNTLLNLAWRAEECGADVVYLADSNGSLVPEQVTDLVHTLKTATKLSIGFHAHDNLCLAMSNSIAAIKAGATFIDSSLRGMGKGSGNLNLESWLSYINNLNNSECYELDLILRQVNSLQKQHYFTEPVRGPVDMLLGMKNLSVEHRYEVETSFLSDVFQAFNIADQLREATV